MASVNFEKIKAGGKPVSAYIRHDDENERIIHDHANPDINKELTSQNKKWLDLSYEDTNKRFRDRIDFLDKTTNTNKRKDRVECYSLYVPIPAAVKDKESFFRDLTEMCAERFGKDNIINSYLHVDEVHDYMENGVVKTSLEHAHVLVVPEIDGGLNGKMFSGKDAMRSFNKEVDDMCREKYHCQFNTGEPAKHKTVEELKDKSEKEAEMVLSLSDRSAVVPKKNGLTDVTISKKDYKKLVNKASAYDSISESQENSLSQLESDRLRFQEEHKKAEAYRINKKKLDESIKEKEAAEKELHENIESLERAMSQIKSMKNNINYSLEEKQAEYDDYIAKIEGAIAWERDNISSFEKYVHSEVMEYKYESLEKENEKLKDENKALKNVIKMVSNAINKVHKFIQENLDIIPDFIRKGIEQIKDFLDKVLEKEHTRDDIER